MRLLVLLFAASSAVLAREFTVLVYNVENLFDVDGVAIFEDYQQDEPDDPYTYGRRKMLTKLKNAGRTLKAIEGGPEIVLFQELENDFTPDSRITDYPRFLESTRGLTAEQMLTTRWADKYAGIPASAWLLKHLEDIGLSGYQVVVAEPTDKGTGIAHTNAVFTRFPVSSVKRHPVENARDILEVEVDIGGRPLVLFNNHWKSGASDPSREPIRVQNASVLRARVDALLEADPYADIIIGGDLNSHYNHAKIFESIDKTGINHVLGSQGDEMAIREAGGPDLYNLWFELPPDDRYTEIWRGRKGTLMHILITRGLYDRSGISYVDGSFGVLVIPEVNADQAGRPLAWTFAGDEGGGFSDHFPVHARFSTGEGEPGAFYGIRAPGSEDSAPDKELPFELKGSVHYGSIPDGAFLCELPPGELGPHIGKLYRIEGRIVSRDPLRIKVGDVEWLAYVPDPDLFDKLPRDNPNRRHRFIATVKIWKGAPEWVIEELL